MGNDMIAAVLLARGADIFAAVRNGSTPLHWCVAEGHTAVAELLLSSNQRILEVTDSDGDTALHWCCLKGHLDCAELLITRHGANVHAIDVGGYTPLLWAVEKKRVAIVDMLLKNGARSDILVKNHNGFDCLEMSLKKKNKAIHQRLLIELDGGLQGGCGAPCTIA
jgi:palmitoyltransferase